MLALPPTTCALSKYAPAVPVPAWLKNKTSFACKIVFVNVKLTVVDAASAAPSIVIWPLCLLNVTPVDLLVNCVTEPPAPLA